MNFWLMVFFGCKPKPRHWTVMCHISPVHTTAASSHMICFNTALVFVPAILMAIKQFYFLSFCDNFSSREGVAGIVTRIYYRRFISRYQANTRGFVYQRTSKRLRGLLSVLFKFRRGTLPGAKDGDRLTDHSLPSIAEIKNEWSYTSIPSHDFLACTGTTVPLPLLK